MRIWELWIGALLCTASLSMGSGSLESPELAWLLANEGPPLALRRITPKSVFLAPTFSSCSEGYQQDSLGRCVKVVKINQAAQWNFFLQKLNSMYAAPAKTEKPVTGPLRLPIPFELSTTTMGPPTTVTSSSTETDDITSTVIPTSTLAEEEKTESPLLIIVANTTDYTTLPTEETTEFSTTENPTETTTTTQPPQTTINNLMASSSFNEATNIEAPFHLSTRWTPIRFPSQRPGYVKFPYTEPPFWWHQTWDPNWQPQRNQGRREPRPSWIHQ